MTLVWITVRAITDSPSGQLKNKFHDTMIDEPSFSPHHKRTKEFLENDNFSQGSLAP